MSMKAEGIEAGVDVTLADEAGNAALHQAAGRGDAEVVRLLLSRSTAELNVRGQRGMTPLLLALTHGHAEVVKYLLEEGADATLADEDGNTALYQAVELDQAEIVRLLLSRSKAELNVRGERGMTPLLLALSRRHTEMVKYLLEEGADVQMKYVTGNTALYLAAGRGHAEFVRLLLSYSKAELNMRGQHGMTPLLLALSQGHTEVVKYLLEEGADATLADETGNTSLYQAAGGGHGEIVRLLLPHSKADLNVRGQDGMTPLILALRRGRAEVAKYLLEAGADVTLVDEGGNTALHLAAGRGYAEIVRILLSHSKAELNMKGQRDMTPLLLALSRGHAEIVKYLLEAGADVTLANEIGNAALHQAAGGGHGEIVRILLSHSKAELNVRGQRGMTPLLLALSWGHAEIVKYLLEAGADVTLANEAGNTALQQAVELDQAEIVRILLSRSKAELNVRGQGGMTPLLLALSWGHAEIVKYLLEAGADTTLVDETENAALHQAARRGHGEIVRLLLSHSKAKLNLRGECGMTPLLLALSQGHTEIANYLLEAGADATLADEAGNAALHQAAGRGHAETVRILLSHSKAELNVRGQRGMTPLLLALSYGRAEVANYLLEAGADATLADEAGNAALHQAAGGGHAEIVRLLLSRSKAELNVRGQDGGTPLLLALSQGHAEVAKYLLEEGADVTLADEVENTALYQAVGRGNGEFVRLLLSRSKAELNVRGQDGMTPLLLALSQGHAEVAKYLLEAGADATLADEVGNTALYQAVGRGNGEFVRLLLSRSKADLNVRGQGGMTPLLLALSQGHAEVVKYLLEAGADSTLADEAGNAALHQAAGDGHGEIVRLLLSHSKAGLNVRGQDGRTPLLLALCQGHAEAVKYLLEAGADATLADEAGNAALHQAAGRGHGEIVRLLLSQPKAELNVRGQCGMTPLLLALSQGHAEVAKYLLKEGADVTLADDTGNVAIHQAAGRGRGEMVCLLLSRFKAELNVRGPHGMTPLLLALTQGHAGIVKYLLEAGADATLADEAGHAALHQAAGRGHGETVRLLLSHSKAELNVKSQRGMTPLLLALSGGHAEVVKYLLEAGADVTLADETGATALYQAAGRGNGAIVRLLLSHSKAELNVKGQRRMTPLLLALSRGYAEVVKYLLEAGADVTLADEAGNTALYQAVGRGHAEIVRLLLSHSKAELNVKGQRGMTPLLLALRQGYTEVVKYLLEAGADVTLTDEAGNAALHQAAGRGHGAIVRLLLSHSKAELNVKGQRGMTPLLLALSRGYAEVVKYLLEAGADVTLVDEAGNTALYQAVGRGHVEFVRLLLSRSKAELNVRGQHGMTPLLLALSRGHAEVAKYLLEAGADVTLADEAGNAALHQAAGRGHGEIVRLLLSHSKAELNVRGECGMTPLLLALSQGHAEVVKYLLEAGADVTLADEAGNTALHQAVGRGHVEFVRLLLSHSKAALNVRGQGGMTPLLLALSQGHAEVVKYLLEAGADATLADEAGNTALHQAAGGGHAETVRLLLSHSKAGLNVRGEGGMTSLLLALSQGHAEAVKYLLEAGADATLADEAGNAALHQAAGGGQAGIVRLLLSRSKAELNVRGQDGGTPLLLALSQGHAEVAKYLLEAGADATLADEVGNAALHQAAGRGHAETVRLLLSYSKAELNVRGQDGGPPLLLALSRGHAEVVKYLLEAGADVTLADEVGNAALHQAAGGGHAEIVRLLLSGSKAELNVRGQHGMTPLLLALSQGHAEVVKYLLEAGADVTLADEVGNTALYLAVELDQVEIVRLLLSHSKAELNVKGQRGMTLLLLALRRGHAEVVKYLLEAGADVTLADEAGNTALYQAVGRGHSEIVRILLSHSKAELNVRGQRGMTPLLLALSQGHAGVVKYLLEEGADVTLANEVGDTALHLAVMKKNSALVKLLLAYPEIEINAKNCQGIMPLMMAFHIQCLEIAKLLISSGADISVTGENNNTVLHLEANKQKSILGGILSLSSEHQQLIKTLVLPNQWGDTPFHLAVKAQESSVMIQMLDLLGEQYAAKILLQPNLKSHLPWQMIVQYHGVTVVEKALHYLIPRETDISGIVTEADVLTLCLLLLCKRLDVNTLAKQLPEQVVQLLLLVDSCTENDVSNTSDRSEELMKLLQMDLLANALPEAGMTLIALLINTSLFDREVLPALLTKLDKHSVLSLCLFQINPQHDYLLHALCKHPDYARSAALLSDILTILSDKDVLTVVNSSNIEGNAPLHSAAMYGNHEVAKVLLAHGAQLDRRNLDGNKPQQVSRYPDEFLALTRRQNIPTEFGSSLQMFGSVLGPSRTHSSGPRRTASSSTAASSSTTSDDEAPACAQP
jgi:ankyrin repeat protein